MGGLRSAAQMVSYEVPFGLSIVGVLMMTGSLDLVTIVRYQEINAWNFLPQIVACFIFLVSMNAENNRTPFDLPEAESELVAGYHTEYSAMKFAFFMLGEYSMMIVNSSLIVTLFFGGWTLGMFGIGLTTDALQSMGLLGGLIGAAIFFTKVMLFLLMYVWFRATFPRFRFDQLMDLGWKFMIPLALVNICVTGLFILAGQERTMNLIGVAVIGAAAFYLFRKPAAKPKPAVSDGPTVPPQKVIHAS
jgi:NADH-quinone oxidoreductase subunit H